MRTKQLSTKYSPIKRATLALLTCAFLLGVVGACDDGTTPPFGSFDAVVFGAVKTMEAVPLSGAVVRVRLYRDSLDARPSNFSPVRSDETGIFTRQVAFPTDPSVAGLDIEVEAPPGSGLADTTFTVEPVELEFRTDPPFDSLRVDVVLPPETSDDDK